MGYTAKELGIVVIKSEQIRPHLLVAEFLRSIQLNKEQKSGNVHVFTCYLIFVILQHLKVFMTCSL